MYEKKKKKPVQRVNGNAGMNAMKPYGESMRKYNINANIIRVIESLYDKAQSAVLFNGSKGDWLRTTVEVRQGCLLSPTLFNIFLDEINV